MKADLGQFVVLWASTFGISYTLSSLHGPFGLCEQWREWAKKQTTEAWILKGIECPICLSFWVSCFIVPVLFGSDTSLRHLITGVASSVGVAAAIILLSPPADDSSSSWGS